MVATLTHSLRQPSGTFYAGAAGSVPIPEIILPLYKALISYLCIITLKTYTLTLLTFGMGGCSVEASVQGSPCRWLA